MNRGAQLGKIELQDVKRAIMNRYMRNQREWPIRVLDKIAPALKWQDGLDIFIAANSEEKEQNQALADALENVTANNANSKEEN